MNTAKTKLLVDLYNVKTLKADKTGNAPEVDALLKQLGNRSRAIPYYAIYPAGGGEPIHFGNRPITAEEIVEKLKQAGPSKVKSAEESTAMR